MPANESRPPLAVVSAFNSLGWFTHFSFTRFVAGRYHELGLDGKPRHVRIEICRCPVDRPLTDLGHLRVGDFLTPLLAYDDSFVADGNIVRSRDIDERVIGRYKGADGIPTSLDEDIGLT